MADETTPTQEKTFTQADVDKLIEENNAKHQNEMDALASKMRAEFKEKEQKAKEAAEKAAKQANMSEYFRYRLSNRNDIIRKSIS